MKKVTVRIGAMALISCASITAIGPAHADDVSTNGCTPGAQLLSVADLSAAGYEAPAYLDSPTTLSKGLANTYVYGNGDGWICAIPRGKQTTSWGAQLYGFEDNFRTYNNH